MFILLNKKKQHFYTREQVDGDSVPDNKENGVNTFLKHVKDVVHFGGLFLTFELKESNHIPSSPLFSTNKIHFFFLLPFRRYLHLKYTCRLTSPICSKNDNNNGDNSTAIRACAVSILFRYRTMQNCTCFLVHSF